MANLSQEKPNVSLFHIIISAILTYISWILSLSIFFPLLISLKISQSLRKKFFAWIFPLITKLFVGKFNPLRRKLFELLPTNIENYRLLEIGVGTGANFEFYPENCKISLLDMNENFESEMQERLKKFPTIKVENIILGMAEDMSEISDSTYDVVVCTHLLCSVRDLDAVFKEVHRVLKKGGKFAYLEHVNFPKNHMGYWIQVILSPLWCIYMNGCNLDRNSHTMISEYFSQNSYQLSYPLFLPLIFRPHAVGIAVK